MSKPRRAKHKARRRHQKAVALLGQLASDLNALEKAGCRIRDPRVGLLTDYGAIVKFRTGWAVRPFKGRTRLAPDDLDD